MTEPRQAGAGFAIRSSMEKNLNKASKTKHTWIPLRSGHGYLIDYVIVQQHDLLPVKKLAVSALKTFVTFVKTFVNSYWPGLMQISTGCTGL